MAAPVGPKKVHRYTLEFKIQAVKLSSLPGVLIQDVAAALDIHPFMLSLWRRQVRNGVIVARGAKLDVQTQAELKRLRILERQYKVLKEEHTLLKKAIRFASDRKRKSLGSSKQTGPNTKSH
jgi:transposase